VEAVNLALHRCTASEIGPLQGDQMSGIGGAGRSLKESLDEQG
jgi:hypothetical protein